MSADPTFIVIFCVLLFAVSVAMLIASLHFYTKSSGNPNNAKVSSDYIQVEATANGKTLTLNQASKDTSILIKAKYNGVPFQFTIITGDHYCISMNGQASGHFNLDEPHKIATLGCAAEVHIERTVGAVIIELASKDSAQRFIQTLLNGNALILSKINALTQNVGLTIDRFSVSHLDLPNNLRQQFSSRSKLAFDSKTSELRSSVRKKELIEEAHAQAEALNIRATAHAKALTTLLEKIDPSKAEIVIRDMSTATFQTAAKGTSFDLTRSVRRESNQSTSDTSVSFDLSPDDFGFDEDDGHLIRSKEPS